MINEKNIHILYQLTIGNYLEKEEEKLSHGNQYRHDSVYIVGQDVENTGLPHYKLAEYMKRLVDLKRIMGMPRTQQYEGLFSSFKNSGY